MNEKKIRKEGILEWIGEESKRILLKDEVEWGEVVRVVLLMEKKL